MWSFALILVLTIIAVLPAIPAPVQSLAIGTGRGTAIYFVSVVVVAVAALVAHWKERGREQAQGALRHGEFQTFAKQTAEQLAEIKQAIAGDGKVDDPKVRELLDAATDSVLVTQQRLNQQAAVAHDASYGGWNAAVQHAAQQRHRQSPATFFLHTILGTDSAEPPPTAEKPPPEKPD